MWIPRWCTNCDSMHLIVGMLVIQCMECGWTSEPKRRVHERKANEEGR